MTELFQIEECLSPRLKWMREHRIELREKAVITGKEWAWAAVIPGVSSGYGNTQDEALSELAGILGVPLWNEKGGKQ